MPQPGSRPASSTPWHPHLERPPDLTKTIEIMKWVEAIPCLLAIHGSCWNVWTGSGKLIECYRVRVLYGCVPSPSPALGEGIMRWHYEDYATGTWKKLTCPSWLESQTLVRFIISQSGLYFSSHSLGIQHGSRAQISHFLSLKKLSGTYPSKSCTSWWFTPCLSHYFYRLSTNPFCPVENSWAVPADDPTDAEVGQHLWLAVVWGSP